MLTLDAATMQEHHLQAALQAVTAPSATTTTTQAHYHIPTPATKTVLSTVEAKKLYNPSAFELPHGYNKASATVEECIEPSYCLDEDDQEWLDKQNAQTHQARLQPSTLTDQTNGTAQGSTTQEQRRPVGVDEFEMVMTVFER